MDRNDTMKIVIVVVYASLSARRAWIEISGGASARPSAAWSLSARRAWIEISGVDFAEDWLKSLSARRAWIEILFNYTLGCFLVSSLSARRAWIEILIALPETLNFISRSPQGERG